MKKRYKKDILAYNKIVCIKTLKIPFPWTHVHTTSLNNFHMDT